MRVGSNLTEKGGREGERKRRREGEKEEMKEGETDRDKLVPINIFHI